jgi:RNA polymerase sigma-70 factor, ECF subfamily
VSAADPDSELRELWLASYARLVGVVRLAAGGSTAEAEDLVSEAFARLVPRWSQVRDHDSPEAWLCTVALRLASNRRRSLGNRRRALRRHGEPADAAPPSPDRVAVLDALSTLPLPQRQVVVLHHLLDLDVAEVASRLRVPVGTVKSRLSRARAALAPLLAEESSRA